MRAISLLLATLLLLAGCASTEPDMLASEGSTQEPTSQNSTEAVEAESDIDPQSESAPAEQAPDEVVGVQAGEPEETPEAGVAPQPTASSGPSEAAMEQPEATASPVPQPGSSTATLQQLVNIVPEQNLASLKQHFAALDAGAKGQEPFPIRYQTGPTAVPEKVQVVIDRFSEKLKLFQLVGLRSLDQDWVIVSEKDYDWWVEYRLSQDPDYPTELWNPKLNELGHCPLSSSIFCGAGNGVNGKNYQDNVVGTRFVDRGLDYVTRHEATHFYQAVFGYGGRCWFAEGQATFFETYLETSSRSRSQIIQDLKQSPSKVAQASEAKLIDLVSSDMVCNDDPDIAYELGMLAFEYLYMNLSFTQVHELMSRSSEVRWNQAVQEITKRDPTEFNTQLASYIYSQFN